MCTKTIRRKGIVASLFIIWVILSWVLGPAVLSAPEKTPDKVILGGFPFGTRIETEGVIVTAVRQVDSQNGIVCPGEKAGILPGDVITKLDGKEVKTCDDVTQIIGASKGSEIEIEVLRDGSALKLRLTPVLSRQKDKYKSGLWIRDGAAGIGTVTYVMPDSLDFAGLGHGICDSDTGKIIPISVGRVFNVDIFGITKSEKGCAGELRGRLRSEQTGELVKNTISGVFGRFDFAPQNREQIDIGKKDEVREGDCTIVSTLDSNIEIRASAKIIKILDKDGKTKNLLIEVTDKNLLSKTGGIVQGMSGSPIIQNGKLIGAVTHVLIDEPTRGYGIFIENMLA